MWGRMRGGARCPFRLVRDVLLTFKGPDESVKLFGIWPHCLKDTLVTFLFSIIIFTFVPSVM